MIKDITGQKFGRLTAIEFAGHKEFKNGDKRTLWKCKCDCGNIIYVTENALQSGNTTSCGCRAKEISHNTGKKNKVHGMSNTRLYNIWHGIKYRCLNPSSYEYGDYGGRGITICDEWKNDFTSFMNWSLENGYSDGLTIDRINVNGDYEPGNCRWATLSEQARNTRKSRLIEAFGKTQTLADWADEYGLIPETLSYRLNHGYSIERALNEKPIDWNRYITYNGQTKNLTDWGKELGIKPRTLGARLNVLGWSVERAFTEDVRKITKKNIADNDKLTRSA